MPTFQIIVSDVLDGLRSLPDGSVRCCVTSPPYWGLRDYGHAGQIGLERTPEEYVAKMVEVFREVRRVLAEDGTCWLNLGSSYFNSGPSGPQGKTGQRATRTFTVDGLGSGAVGASGRTPSRQQRRAPAYGTDDTELQDSMGAGSACSDLCDECLADFLNHRGRIAGSGQPLEQSAPQPLPTGRDIEHSDSASASLGASPPSSPGSTTIESWRQHRGACSRCDSRALSLLSLRASDSDVPRFSGTEGYTSGSAPHGSGRRRLGTDVEGMAWQNYTTRLKHKDLVPIPWMVAMALQADGWWLRQDIIWAKGNPMPESVRDRCTKAHEYVFLLSKAARYYYDAGAVAEAVAYPELRLRRDDGETDGYVDFGMSRGRAGTPNDTRNRRSVWTIATQPFPGAHFAVMPEALVEPCVLAGSAVGDTVLDPFAGSGTVGVVALRHGRHFIGCELNPTYADMARDRVVSGCRLFAEEITPDQQEKISG